MNSRVIFLLVSKSFLGLGLLIGCATTTETPRGESLSQSPEVSKKEKKPSPVAAPREIEPDREPVIDLLTLRKALKMNRSIQTLGFQEKMFEDCGGEFGLPKRSSCHPLFLVQIHFRIQCRDSEGTVSEAVTEEELAPLADRKIQWSLRNLQGEIQTDSRGFGQILTLSPISQKLQRLKLLASEDFLYLPAGEIKRVITPKNWCQ